LTKVFDFVKLLNVIIYTRHAKERLSQRKIPESFIEQTLSSPSSEIISSFGKRKIARKVFDKKILEVVFKEENNDMAVITAYWVMEENEL